MQEDWDFTELDAQLAEQPVRIFVTALTEPNEDLNYGVVAAPEEWFEPIMEFAVPPAMPDEIA